jgi:hypothetical protein
MELLKNNGPKGPFGQVDFVKGKILAGDAADLDVLSEGKPI